MMRRTAHAWLMLTVSTMLAATVPAAAEVGAVREARRADSGRNPFDLAYERALAALTPAERSMLLDSPVLDHSAAVEYGRDQGRQLEERYRKPLPVRASELTGELRGMLESQAAEVAKMVVFMTLRSEEIARKLDFADFLQGGELLLGELPLTLDRFEERGFRPTSSEQRSPSIVFEGIESPSRIQIELFPSRRETHRTLIEPGILSLRAADVERCEVTLGEACMREVGTASTWSRLSFARANVHVRWRGPTSGAEAIPRWLDDLVRSELERSGVALERVEKPAIVLDRPIRVPSAPAGPRGLRSGAAAAQPS